MVENDADDCRSILDDFVEYGVRLEEDNTDNACVLVLDGSSASASRNHSIVRFHRQGTMVP